MILDRRLLVRLWKEKDEVRKKGVKGSGVGGESTTAKVSLTAAFAFLLSRRSLVDEETTNSGRHMADYSPQDVETRSFCPPLTKYHVDRRMHFRSFRNSLFLAWILRGKGNFESFGEIRIHLLARSLRNVTLHSFEKRNYKKKSMN